MTHQDDVDDIINGLLAEAQSSLNMSQQLLDRIADRLRKVACVVEDHFDRFFRDCCSLSYRDRVSTCELYRVSTSELYRAYVCWCENPLQQEVVVPRTTLHKVLKERFRDNVWRYRSVWNGIRLKSESERPKPKPAVAGEPKPVQTEETQAILERNR